MSKLSIRGRLQYIPGPWGMTEPVKSATVKIIDLDPGGSDDTILTKTTNSLGKFSGLSKDWQDTKRIRYWEAFPLPGRWKTKNGPDPTDIMLLEIDIKEGDNRFRGPFVFLGDNVEVPIVVPWGKAPLQMPATIKVNGVACTDGVDLQKKARAAFESDTSVVKIEVRGPESLPFQVIAGKNLSQLKDLVDNILPGAREMLYSNPIGAAELMAIAVIILAVGAATSVSIIATGIAVSLILAILLGYTDIQVKVVNSDSQNPLPGIEFVLKKG